MPDKYTAGTSGCLSDGPESPLRVQSRFIVERQLKSRGCRIPLFCTFILLYDSLL